MLCSPRYRGGTVVQFAQVRLVYIYYCMTGRAIGGGGGNIQFEALIR